MKIRFNENEKTIEIKDGLKQQYFLINLALIFTLVNSVLFPVFVFTEKQLKGIGFVWILLGVSSAGLLIYQQLKKTASETLEVTEIDSLVEKDVFGRKRFSLKLTNGKLRDLMEMRTESDILEMKKVFAHFGIKTT